MNSDEVDVLRIKIIQSGEIRTFELDERLLTIKFKQFVSKLLKSLGLKPKDVYFSNEEGKMISTLYHDSPIKEIIQKFGAQLNLYYEKIF